MHEGTGRPLPLAKTIAAYLRVNKNTVLRAMHILRDEGLVEFARRQGDKRERVIGMIEDLT